ncbi:class I SAM-dependent methyltransferase family protein [Methanoregula sp.]|uniref:class I SAM-dependent methyltransferase n=1 Tax=Methanoregula sp. TaxID=2052170 RepID=UPI002C6B2593|nr:class I SAM-dependent methyltransferase family protein [Methanoregula sp.]HVP96467.1 class I SAM-dependent methyltransferase family protein [Methanoregula sp.]
MTVEHWGVRVPVRKGEETRQALLREGLLDCSLKVTRDGNDLVFPVIAEQENAGRYLFEGQPGREELPRHELIGGIAIMQENDPAGAARILTSRPSLHTVLYPTSEVAGAFRTRSFTVLAGTDTTRTEVVEHGHRFSVDLAGAYFSARLSTERQRIAEKMGKNELVLDMFAGVGPFAITLAPKAALVVAADLNPRAVALLMENTRKNRAGNVLPLLFDARRLGAVVPWKFDRIVMNLPLAGTEFLAEAFRLLRPGGTIHFYSLVSCEGEHQDRIRELGGTGVTERMVRSYSPGQWHAVYDIVTGPA